MARLNLTLDKALLRAVERHATKRGQPRASFARELIREGLKRREKEERAKELARDYEAGRKETREILEEMEAAQLELIGDEEA